MASLTLLFLLVVFPPLLAQSPSPRFQEVTVASGILFLHHDAPALPPLLGQKNTHFGVGAAVSDYDRDGDQDVYICDSYGWPNRLFQNHGDGTFTDVTEAAGVGSRRYSHMALFLDLDNDGFDDLVVINDNSSAAPLVGGSQIYRNQGDGTFADVTPGSGFEPVEPVFGGAAAADYDRDGDLDLLLVGWYDTTTHLYRNEGNFRFIDVTVQAGLLPENRPAHWTPVFLDLTGDDWPDIFVAVDFQEDLLYRNKGDGTFTDVSREAGTLHVNNDMGVAVGDLDGDLDLDLYSTNISGAEYCNTAAGCNILYANDGSGRFSDRTHTHRLGDTDWGWGAWFFDAELDGDLDLLAVNGWMQPEWHTPARFFRNQGRGSFSESAKEAGIAHVGNTRSLVPLDLEGDGDVDFLMFDVLAPGRVFRNVTPRGRHHYLVVEAEGVDSNRNGIGSRIYVRTGEVWQMRTIMAGGSFYAGPPLEAHFGLGSAGQADEVRVVFPSGRESRLFQVEADRRLLVREPTPLHDAQP